MIKVLKIAAFVFITSIGFLSLSPQEVKEPVIETQSIKGAYTSSYNYLNDYTSQLGNFYVGVTAPAGSLNSDSAYRDFVNNHFDFVVSDWEAHWGIDKNDPFRFGPTSYNYWGLDQYTNYINTYNKSSRVHHLVWGAEESLPNWLLDGTFTDQELKDFITNHVTSVVTKYKDSVNTWSVVNEYSGYPWNADFWFDNLGGHDWVKSAFVAANNVAPNSELIINDALSEYPAEQMPSRYNSFYSLVTTLLNEGTPIDGIGFQMHLDAQYFLGGNLNTKIEQIRQNILRYQALGLNVHFTELDVRMDNVAGTELFKQELQADIYREIFKVAIDTNVKGITLFSANDQLSWYAQSAPNAKATMFSTFNEPKLAFSEVVTMIQNDYLTPATPVVENPPVETPVEEENDSSEGEDEETDDEEIEDDEIDENEEQDFEEGNENDDANESSSKNAEEEKKANILFFGVLTLLLVSITAFIFLSIKKFRRNVK